MKITELITSVISEYKRNGLFSEWLDTQTTAILSNAFNLMCHDTTDTSSLQKSGKALYMTGVPPGAILLMIEKMQSFVPIECIPILTQHKHLLTHAYLIEKLLADRQNLIHLINDSVSLFTTANNVIAIAHIRWLKQWIDTRLGEGNDPIMDPTKCEVGEWIHHSIDRYILDPRRRQGFIEDHKTLHGIANSTKIFFDREEYLYALELYLDLRSFTLRLREQFNFLFLREKLELLKLDSLTGLYNRFSLFEDLQEHGGDCYVILNIRDFSKMNMLYGRGYGDEIIISVANTLRKYIPYEKIYRFYADEFALIIDTELCPDIPNTLRKIEEDLEANERILTAISFYGAYGTIDKSIFDRCEYAIMSRHERRERFINADIIMQNEIEKFTENLTISQKLRIALSNDKIVPYFQPIASTKTDNILRFEALMRVIDENGNVLLPGTFLPVLEHMYIYPECTKTICKKVFEVFVDRSEGFSINFSLSDIQNDETRLFLFALFEKYPEAASRCTIELLENEAVIDFKRVNDFFNLLKLYKVKSALDDFGAGFSNFAYLFNLHIDYIKIDGSIIQRLDDPKMAKLAKTIVSMAHDLEIQTIAEFVSEKVLMEHCKSIGIDMLQGYHIGYPLPMNEI
jgi:EAL domain-containing protein (putative c-di-GMP-specific phosphodiesterase class I)/GGDEF domain-containing protein